MRNGTIHLSNSRIGEGYSSSSPGVKQDGPVFSRYSKYHETVERVGKTMTAKKVVDEIYGVIQAWHQHRRSALSSTCSKLRTCPTTTSTSSPAERTPICVPTGWTTASNSERERTRNTSLTSKDTLRTMKNLPTSTRHNSYAKIGNPASPSPSTSANRRLSTPFENSAQCSPMRIVAKSVGIFEGRG